MNTEIQIKQLLLGSTPQEKILHTAGTKFKTIHLPPKLKNPNGIFFFAAFILLANV
jgi:hypothetical protein